MTRNNSITLALCTALCCSCAAEQEQGGVTVSPEEEHTASQARGPAADELTAEETHRRRIADDIQQLNARIAAESPDPAWQHKVEGYFQDQWTARYPALTDLQFTQKFTCSVNLCAARVEYPDAVYIQPIKTIVGHMFSDTEEQLWGRAALRSVDGDELQTWIFVWRPGASRL